MNLDDLLEEFKVTAKQNQQRSIANGTAGKAASGLKR
jgi:hypothetical protein